MTETFNVEFYETSETKSPILDFVKSLDVKLRAKVFRDLGLLEKNGNNLGMPFSRLLDDGIFELRTKSGSNNVRLLYFFMIGKTIIVTNGFKKKTQKTPTREITLAKKYREEYLLRKSNVNGGKN